VSVDLKPHTRVVLGDVDRPAVGELFDEKRVARLAGYAGGAQVNVAVQTNVSIDVGRIAERLIARFDDQPEVKAQIARALLEIDDEQSA